MADSSPARTPSPLERTIRLIAAARKAEAGALIEILHEIQAEFGYLPAEVPALVADELNLSRAEVHGVVTFYRDFRSQPVGRTTVRVCRAEACQSVGAHQLAEHATARLGVGFGQTTPDHSVTLDQVFCFGNCALGPTVEINGLLYGRVDPERFDALVAGETS